MKSLVYTKRFIQAFKDPEKIQTQTLKRILKKNQLAQYGKRYGFEHIKTVKDYQREVPIIEYDDILPEIERLKLGEQGILTTAPVEYFASTSGTTSGVKLVPVTKERVQALKTEFIIWMRLTLKGHLKDALGKILYIAGPYYEGITEGGTPYGSISGYLLYKGPDWAKKRLAIPIEVFNELDYERKLYLMAFHALQTNVTHLGFTTSIEVLLLFDYIRENWEQLVSDIEKKNPRRGKKLRKVADPKPANIWPKLHLANCFMTETSKIYMQTLMDVIGRDIVVRDPGINASEGRISLGICDDQVSGYPAVYNTFFEFQDYDDPKSMFLIHELVKGHRYKIILTTSEGLYRYNTGDVVEITGFQNQLPQIRFYQRDHFLNIVGELAFERELVNAMELAMEKTGVKVEGFTYVPNYPSGYARPRYEVLIEVTEGSTPLEKSFTRILDESLMNYINDYRQMRHEFGRLDPPIVSVIRQGSWQELNQRRIVRAGQPKYIHIAKDPSFRDNFTIIESFEV